jgi:hypothetical protein
MTGQDLQAEPPGDMPIHLAWSRTEAPTSPQWAVTVRLMG